MVRSWKVRAFLSFLTRSRRMRRSGNEIISFDIRLQLFGQIWRNDIFTCEVDVNKHHRPRGSKREVPSFSSRVTYNETGNCRFAYYASSTKQIAPVRMSESRSLISAKWITDTLHDTNSMTRRNRLTRDSFYLCDPSS